MSNGTEQIEARLAAYIDGELPDSERAEIEKYLTANPAHRQMIEELKGQHEMVASLPREKAPAEILDHLQGHLERQSLLENVEDAAGSLRINRWPQFGAIAAMLLLTVGLGALVYSVLPGGALNREQVTIATPDVQGLPAAPSLTDRDKESVTALKDDIEPRRDRVLSSGSPRVLMPGESTARRTNDGIGNGFGGDFVDGISRDVEAKRQEELRAGREKAVADARLAAAAAPTSPLALNNGSAIVISTDDPMITQNLLAGYLGQNDFDFHSVRPELARAATSLNELMILPADEASKKDLAPGAQQAIGSVVSRVNQRENAQAAGEQYMVVRNLSKDQAARLNGIINTQRGARQQSRLYGNADLYPEYNQFNRQYNDANAGMQQAGAQQLKQEEPQQQRQYAEKASPVESANKSKDNQTEVVPNANATINSNTNGIGEGAVVGNVPAATQPQADVAAVGGVSDVLIVVRNEPPAEPGMAAVPPIAADGEMAPTTAPASEGASAGGAAAPPATGPAAPSSSSPAGAAPTGTASPVPTPPVPTPPVPSPTVPAPAAPMSPAPAPATLPATTQPLNPQPLNP